MIVVLKPGTGAEKKEKLIQWLEHQGMRVHISDGDYQTVLGIIGDASRLDLDLVESLEIVDKVSRVTEPFKCCNRKFHPEDMVVSASGVPIGGGHFAMIAGPCSVETEEQILTVAKAVKAAGADLLSEGQRTGAAAHRPGGDRPSLRDGADGHPGSGALCRCGRDPGGRPQHAEL